MPPRVLIGVGAVVLLLIALQIVAMRQEYQGPLASLWQDYVGLPKSMTVPWAGLVLAMVGLPKPQRIMALGAAIGIDVVFAGGRLLLGEPFGLGNGPMIVLTGVAVLAWWRLSDPAHRAESKNALHAAALGALLMLATKIGDVWLHVTSEARPQVLDEYVILADHALGDPSWVMGRVLDTLGPGVSGVLHWVYIELPLAAILVAVWQLRNVASSGRWPTHYLVRTFLVLGLLGPIIYVIFPVVGPIFAFGSQGHGLELGNYWPGVVPPLDRDPGWMPFDTFTPRNCMPSMHTAWAMSVFLHTRRTVSYEHSAGSGPVSDGHSAGSAPVSDGHSAGSAPVDGGPAPRWLRWGGTFWLLATLTATLGFGYHYGVDLVAGAVLCLTVESALRAPERGWGWFRIRMVGFGLIALAALLISYRYLAVHMAEYPVLAGTVVLGLLAAVGAAFHATWFAEHHREPVAAVAEPVK